MHGVYTNNLICFMLLPPSLLSLPPSSLPPLSLSLPLLLPFPLPPPPPPPDFFKSRYTRLTNHCFLVFVFLSLSSSLFVSFNHCSSHTLSYSHSITQACTAYLLHYSCWHILSSCCVRLGLVLLSYLLILVMANSMIFMKGY